MSPRQPQDFRHESLEDPKSLVSYLKALTEGLERGTVTLADASGEIVLNPKGLLHFELRAVKKRGRARLSLSVDWRVADKDDLADNTLSIKPGGSTPPGGSHAP